MQPDNSLFAYGLTLILPFAVAGTALAFMFYTRKLAAFLVKAMPHGE